MQVDGSFGSPRNLKKIAVWVIKCQDCFYRPQCQSKMGETSVLSEVSLLERQSLKPSDVFVLFPTTAAFLTFYFQVDVGHGESQYVSYFEQSSVCTADPVQKYH